MNEAGGDRVVVIGLGNPIMGDDGIGLAALERLREEWTRPESVELVDGGTWGMNLLPLIESARALLFLDAIDCGASPGQLITLEREQVPRFIGLKLSPHQIGLSEVLALAELRDRLPPRIVAMGLQPARVEMVSELSPEIERALDQLLAAAVQRLGEWGHPLQRAEPVANA